MMGGDAVLNPDIKTHEQDFIISHYREIIRAAKRNYRFTSYHDVNKPENFILWRHDCDYSLNRSLRLAQIEAEEGVKSTFFLLPHCEFYNLLEKSQSSIVKKIIELGHDIGLHFDCGYYDITSEAQLDALVRREADWISDWFGCDVRVFSFHNPDTFSLSCEADQYGGVINCYSSYFKNQVNYCSDSNGYWRFRRLYDVVSQFDGRGLQALTHPGWWQDEIMPPRRRIERCVFGRADVTMRTYDAVLKKGGRQNIS